MSEYIERIAAIRCCIFGRTSLGLIGELRRLPAADVVPVRHGRWIKNDNGTWSCERCHSWIPDEQHYYARFCLYCGAKMDGGADNDLSAQ